LVSVGRIFSLDFQRSKFIFSYFLLARKEGYMRIKNKAQAGRQDTGDVVVELEPIESDCIEIELKSSVERLFGERIKQVALETLKEFDVCGVRCRIVDDGALDFVIKARIEAALERALGGQSER